MILCWPAGLVVLWREKGLARSRKWLATLLTGIPGMFMLVLITAPLATLGQVVSQRVTSTGTVVTHVHYVPVPGAGFAWLWAMLIGLTIGPDFLVLPLIAAAWVLVSTQTRHPEGLGPRR